MTAQAVSSDDGFRRFEPGGRGVVFVQSIVLSDRRGSDRTLPFRSPFRSGRGPWQPSLFASYPWATLRVSSPAADA